MSTSIAILAALLGFSIAASAADATGAGAPSVAAPGAAAAEPQASIAFANHGGIYDWRVVDDRTVLIQGLNRQWYKATLFSSCIDLPFAERVGFESNADGSFDKFSSIKLRNQTCPLTSLTKTAPPARKSKPHKAAEVTTAAPAPAPASAPPPP
jgi:hypothetical protein